MIATLLLAAQLAIVARAPDSAAACELIEVTVTVSAVGSVPPQVLAPPFAPFTLLRASTMPHVDVSGALGTLTANYRYVVTTDRAGRFTLGPFEVRYGGVVARSQPLHIRVRPNDPSSSVPTVVARALVDTSLDVNIRALALPETVFVGQQANYEVAVFLNESVRDRLRRNPTFYPPDMQAMLAYDMPSSQGDLPRRRIGTRCFDALVYQRALFPLVAGRLVIPPAQLTYALPLSGNFFSREESHELQTDSTVVIAVEPPGAGRIPDYAGAVGAFSVRTRLDTVDARVGDPLLLTVRVSGTGNIKLLPRPPLRIPWASIVDGPERVRVDTTARRVRGVKEFDWVLTPRVAGELDLPPTEYPYFNPDSRRYEIATSDALRVHVGSGALANVDTLPHPRTLALRPAFRGALAPPPHERPLFWIFLALAPMPALSIRLRRRPRRRVPETAAARLRALSRSADVSRGAGELRRAFILALAERLGFTPESFTRAGALSRALRRAGVSSTTAADAEGVMRALDAAAYSPGGSLPADAEKGTWIIYRMVDREALARRELRLPAPLALVVVLASAAGAAMALAPDAARSRFDDGVSAYGAGKYAAAAAAFGQVADLEPRAADAWANLGTAAWAASDTAVAVEGWQRALRLEPLAFDARQRMDLVHYFGVGSIGYVPPVPVSTASLIALLLWCAAWALAALRLRRPARIGRWGYGVGAMAVAVALLALAAGERVAGRGISIVRATTPLRTVPAFGSDVGAAATAGEAVRVGPRQGAWSHVSLDDGHDGWVQADRLIALDAGSPTD